MRKEDRESPAMLNNWIGGEAVLPIGGDYIQDTNPATGEVNAWIPRSGKEDVDQAVAAAKEAFAAPSWRQSSAAERADLCDAIADEIERRKEELAVLESKDTGKPVSLAARIDIPRAVSNFRFFAGAVRHAGSDFFQMAEAINYTHRRPVGVVGLITPWNLPLYLLTWKTAPALAMGNTIVAKPSELTPLTATVLAEIVNKLTTPGVFNVLHGYGPEVGQAIVEHPEIKAISFTGGTSTGARVAATAAPMFKKLSLELGGKNPVIVFADSDFEKAVKGTVRASFTNQGQVCLCGSRILVERSIFDRFVAAFAAEVQQMQVGDPSQPETGFGSLVSLDHRDKVEGYIKLAQEEGGTIVCGGKRPVLPAPLDKGAFLEPTVITGLSPNCRTVQEEIFGPVVSIHPFDTEQEAISLANHVKYGLCASVWTESLGRAHRVGALLETGMVWVNTWLLRDLRTPFGGVKESGVGREGGRYSLDFYSEPSNICIHLGSYGQAAPYQSQGSIAPQSEAKSADTLDNMSGAGSSRVVVEEGDAPPLPKGTDEKTSSSMARPAYEQMVADGRTMAYRDLPDGVPESSSVTQGYTRAISREDLVALGLEEPASEAARPHTMERAVIAKPSTAAHAKQVGQMLFLSGVGPADLETGVVPGGTTEKGYDFEAQINAAIDNVRQLLEVSGSGIEHIVDVSVFLIDMAQDGEVCARALSSLLSQGQATHTIVGVNALATPVAVTLKVIAAIP